MLVRCALILMALAGIKTVSAEVTNNDLIGVWHCGPYDMVNDNMVISTKEHKTYNKSGYFKEISTSTLRFSSGGSTTMQIKLEGQWTLAENVITVQFNKATFLSSDNPNYTIAMGQRQADKQMQAKNWAKIKVDVQGDKMIYSPIETMYKEAQVMVRCLNPMRHSGLE